MCKSPERSAWISERKKPISSSSSTSLAFDYEDDPKQRRLAFDTALTIRKLLHAEE